MHKIPSPPQAFFDEGGVNADDRVWDYGRACYALALSRVVPDGWRLVPVIPTEEMIARGDEILAEDGKRVRPESIYDAMVSGADDQREFYPVGPTDGWCSRCGCGNDSANFAHLPSCTAAPAAAGAQGEDAVLFENVRGHVISELNKIARRIANVSPNVSEEVEQLAAMLVVGATEPLTPQAPQPAAADGGVRERAMIDTTTGGKDG